MTIAPEEGVWEQRRTAWALKGAVAQQLSIVVALGGDPKCERYDGIQVDESNVSVEVKAFVSVRVPAADEDLICEASAKLEPVSVELLEPLGSRSLTGCKSDSPIDETFTRGECAELEP